MSLKYSHILKVQQTTQIGSETKAAGFYLTPSMLTKVSAFAPLVLGLLFILKGGITALFGLVLLGVGGLLLKNMRQIIIDKEFITVTPAFKFLSGTSKVLPTNSTTLKRDAVKGDFSITPSDFRFFPLNAQRISAVTLEGDTIVLAYVSDEDAQKMVPAVENEVVPADTAS